MTHKNLTLTTSAIAFAPSTTQLKAEAMLPVQKRHPAWNWPARTPKRQAKNLDLIQQQWRPKSGPAADIPQKKSEFKAPDDEKAKKRAQLKLEQIRRDWKPKMGPLAAG